MRKTSALLLILYQSPVKVVEVVVRGRSRSKVVVDLDIFRCESLACQVLVDVMRVVDEPA